MKCRNLVLGMFALFVIGWPGTAEAEPLQTPRQIEKSLIGNRLHQARVQNRLQRNKGKNGQLYRAAALNRMQLRRNKGDQGLLFRDNRNRQVSSRLLNKARISKLRVKPFFSNRPIVSRVTIGRGQRLRNANTKQRLNYKRWRARMQIKRAAPVAVAPVGLIGSVRSSFHQYLASKSVGALLIEKDPATGKTYRLQHAGAPVTKQLGEGKVAFRCNFYGKTSADSPSVPVSVEYQVTGANTNWKVTDVRFVSVNGERAPGQFAFEEAELFDGDTASADVEELDAKEFPVKSL